jgi:hypothetical protein
MLRRRSVFYAVATTAVVGGVFLLDVANAPLVSVLVYLGVMWALLTYLSRWRGH